MVEGTGLENRRAKAPGVRILSPPLLFLSSVDGDFRRCAVPGKFHHSGSENWHLPIKC